MEPDHRFYPRRAAEERRRAAHAVTAEAQRRHRDLAELFAQRVAELEQSMTG